jgi:hypothetical protein
LIGNPQFGYNISEHRAGVENKDLHREAKISSRHASILTCLQLLWSCSIRNHWNISYLSGSVNSSRQLTCLELFNKKSLEYQLLVWLCEQLQAAHLSGAVQ